MRILVFVRRCVDYTVPVRIKTDGSDVETSGVKMSMNPFDEIACEEAVRIKEKGIASEIIVLGLGAIQTQDTIRHALGMGADRGIFIETPVSLEPLEKAKIIAAIARAQNADLILLGKQAIDDDFGHEGVMTATLLGWNYAVNAASISFLSSPTSEAQTDVSVEQETDNGTEKKNLLLPAVITADLRLNTPRNVPLPKVLEARKKPLEILACSTDIKPHLHTLKAQLPEPRPPVIMLHNIDDLIAKINETMS